VPLCSIIKEGRIDELFRLHIWLPDGKRGDSNVGIHSHQPFAQSWILAGCGRDHLYKVEATGSLEDATHAEYALAWSDGKTANTTYKTHQIQSAISNTGRLVRAIETASAAHKRGDSYSIPEAVYHRSDVAPDEFHATLFVFDSRRGFVKDAGVLGPKDGETFTQLRDPAGSTAATLARLADSFRLCEILLEEGQRHIHRARWEHALRAYNSALSLVDSTRDFPNATRQRCFILDRLGRVNRSFGRYEIAKEILEQALENMGEGLQEVECRGELGVVYRHLGLLEDAKRAFGMQYETAKQLGLAPATCRAVGNLAMVNYQLAQQSSDSELLDLAIRQIQERVQRARDLRLSVGNSSIANPVLRSAINWEIIGLSRLSLMLAARGDIKAAMIAAAEPLDLATEYADSTMYALTYFFYGHALLLNGQVDEARRQFDRPHRGRGCTPAIALTREPSAENLGYMKELVDSGIDLDAVDEHGYTALDWAVFSGDAAFERLILDGLRRTLENESVNVELELEQRRTAARLRKGYRELFQEQLRPALIAGRGQNSIQTLRTVYSQSLAASDEKRALFEGFSFIPYTEFVRFGRLPRSTDGLTVSLNYGDSGDSLGDQSGFVIFFSYRWINKTKNATTPDDENKTQYKRMLSAAEEFLTLNPQVDRDKLAIWLVSHLYCAHW
jgi:tetratricopeptide (TPR) repeat protein